MKKIITVILLVAIIILAFGCMTFNQSIFEQGRGITLQAMTTSKSIGTSITSEDKDLQKLKPGEEFKVDFSITNFTNVDNGIITLMGELEYDNNILERKSISGEGTWLLNDSFFNEGNSKFITDSGAVVTNPGKVFSIVFKVKESITSDIQTIIKIKEIHASGGNGLVTSNDAQVNIKVEIPIVESITSEKYLIEEKYISKILPETTVKEFIQNVETEQNMVFLDEQGNVLTENDLVKTGTTLKVGSTLQYTLGVTGDIDRDGIITVNDLAKLKLHCIDLKKLTGIELKVADVDYTGNVDTNDIARIKLVLINLFEIK